MKIREKILLPKVSNKNKINCKKKMNSLLFAFAAQSDVTQPRRHTNAHSQSMLCQLASQSAKQSTGQSCVLLPGDVLWFGQKPRFEKNMLHISHLKAERHFVWRHPHKIMEYSSDRSNATTPQMIPTLICWHRQTLTLTLTHAHAHPLRRMKKYNK